METLTRDQFCAKYPGPYYTVSTNSGESGVYISNSLDLWVSDTNPITQVDIPLDAVITIEPIYAAFQGRVYIRASKVIELAKWDMNEFMRLHPDTAINILNVMPTALQYIEQTNENRKLALRFGGTAVLPYITDPTPEDVDLAMKSTAPFIARSIPKHLITPQVAERIVKSGSLHLIPEELHTERLYLLLCAHAPDALDQIPEEYHSEELYFASVRNLLSALITISVQSKELCDYALALNPRALQYIHKPTMEMCMYAVSRAGILLRYVPADMQSVALCISAISSDEYACAFVVNWCPDIWKFALEKYGTILRFIPQHRRTIALCAAAVNSNTSELQYCQLDRV